MTVGRAAADAAFLRSEGKVVFSTIKYRQVFFAGHILFFAEEFVFEDKADAMIYR